jgi:hypothetical protein
VTDALGWIGTLCVLCAYAANAWGFVGSQEKLYQGLNFVGAVCLGINVYAQSAWPALTLQVVWGAVAITPLLRSVFTRGA